MAPIRARVVVVIAVLAVTAACSVNIDIGDQARQGSGDVETRTYDLADFDQLDVSSAFVADVSVVAGGDYVVEISADDNLFDELTVEVDRNTLTIGVESGVGIRSDNPLSATVTLPDLLSVEASGASNVTIDAAGTGIEDLEASGASKIRISDLDGDDITIDVSGASRVDLLGIRAERVTIDASGRVAVDLTSLPIDEGRVGASGASVVEFGPAAVVEGDASGASAIRVESETTVDIDTSGGSSVDRS